MKMVKINGSVNEYDYNNITDSEKIRGKRSKNKKRCKDILNCGSRCSVVYMWVYTFIRKHIIYKERDKLFKNGIG